MVLFLAAAMQSRVNIGLRHVLVLYPFLMVLGGHGLSIVSSTSGRGRMIFSALLLLWYFAQAALLTPHHLSYFNLLVGGPRNGHRYLIDSNFDWGQNDRFLKEYLESRAIPYRINPDPFAPSVGNILVNANARYGVLRGPKAYAWLDPFDPVRQIAYTWFEYHVPEGSFREPPRDDTAQRHFLAYLFSLRERFSEVDSPEYGLHLAAFFAGLDAYDLAFDELRAVLSRHPGYEPALFYGGELIVRHKLGVLNYRGDEYLTGFRTERPPGGLSLEDGSVIQMARAYGRGAHFSSLLTVLGSALAREGDDSGALDALGRALQFDPTNQKARAALEHLRVRLRTREPSHQ
jgi:tetratricopeptide (TPR) repeat protein